MRRLISCLLLVGACASPSPDGVPEVEPEPCAAVLVSKTSLSWTGVRLAVAERRELSVTNPCEERVAVDGSVDEASFALADESVTLEPGASATLRVTFTPFDGAAHSGTLLLTPHGGAPVAVALDGVAETDWDGDGYHDERVGGADCDDEDVAVNPDAEEVCNGIDDDCDGTTDDAIRTWYADGDLDGWGSGVVQGGCEPDPGQTDRDGDCDDTDDTVYPGAFDPACDGVDQDCDGTIGGAAGVAGVDHPTIQSALTAAVDGDTVQVCPGTWTESLFVGGKELTLTSYSSDRDDTVLDGEDDRRILEINLGTVTISHLTFTRGRAWVETASGPSGDGGAILAVVDALEIEDCAFVDNTAAYAGGAVSLGRYTTSTNASAITDSEFTGNYSDYEGGALSVSVGKEIWAELSITGTDFATNEAQYEGGGLAWGGWGEGALTLQDTTFTTNLAGYEGGAAAIGAWYPTATVIEGCTFDGNDASYQGGALDVGSWAEGDDVQITDTAFLDNTSRSGAAIELGTWGWADLRVSDSSFTGNASTDRSGAVGLGGRASWLGASFTTVTFDGNTAGSRGAVLAVGSRVEACDVLFDSSTVTANVVASSSSSHGAVEISSVCGLDSIDTDWGAASTDNSPADLCSESGCLDDLGAGETFTCLPGYGC